MNLTERCTKDPTCILSNEGQIADQIDYSEAVEETPSEKQDVCTYLVFQQRGPILTKLDGSLCRRVNRLEEGGAKGGGGALYIFLSEIYFWLMSSA